MIKCRKRRMSCVRITIFAVILVIGYIGIIVNNVMVADNGAQATKDNDFDISIVNSPKNSHHFDDKGLTVDRISSRKLLNTSDVDSEYPPDLFTLEQRRKGAIVLHVIGMVYMFLALAIVCDEFFVPSLGVIIDVLHISEDVAGATFMAAGGSAPELFASFIGLFAAKNNIGIGTIIGSAVFNILFVISVCVLVSKSVLKLTWWPLFRDISFYSFHLLLLILFYRDNIIELYESIVLLLCYVSYVVFMKFNDQISYFVDHILYRRCSKVNADQTDSSSTLKQPSLFVKSSKYRRGVVELLIHAIDPLDKEQIHLKVKRVRAIGHRLTQTPSSITSVCTIEHSHSRLDGSSSGLSPEKHNMNVVSSGILPPLYAKRFSYQWSHLTANGHTSHQPSMLVSNDSNQNITESDIDDQTVESHTNIPTISIGDSRPDSTSTEMTHEEEEKPLNLTWPKSWKKRIMYIIVAPIIFPLYITLPDVRVKTKRSLFVITFLGSITWIGCFSYFMVWWANQTGVTAGIPVEVMGLTVLAAGTSIPDLITSVIVAKKGFGDMAVSSSVGSNIFDITVGLPLPWLMYNIIKGHPVSVSSEGLFCSIILLFIVLVIVLIGIILSKWRLNKTFGLFILGLYAGFLTAALLLQYNIFHCPLSSL